MWSARDVNTTLFIFTPDESGTCTINAAVLVGANGNADTAVRNVHMTQHNSTETFNYHYHYYITSKLQEIINARHGKSLSRMQLCRVVR